jgi:hypothetical protein
MTRSILLSYGANSVAGHSRRTSAAQYLISNFIAAMNAACQMSSRRSLKTGVKLGRRIACLPTQLRRQCHWRDVPAVIALNNLH